MGKYCANGSKYGLKTFADVFSDRISSHNINKFKLHLMIYSTIISSRGRHPNRLYSIASHSTRCNTIYNLKVWHPSSEV